VNRQLFCWPEGAVFEHAWQNCRIHTRGYLAKLEDASEDTSKIVEKEKVEQDEASTHWEDVEEERSRGTDIKSVLELKTEESEEGSEEKFNDDDRGEDDRELFIKGDGFEDDSEDTAEEEMMKQAEVPKSRRV
jgi:hypothetical protein